jgi:phage gp36-like protein
MPYATLTDLAARFGDEELTQLTDRLGTGVVDADVAQAALAEADAEIDAYLAGRYALPLAAVPPILVRLACDIARYRLATDTPLEEVRKRYEDARRLLENLAAGRVTLGLPAVDAPVVVGSVGSSVPAAVFDDAGMAGY